jgi:MFS family permease
MKRIYGADAFAAAGGKTSAATILSSVGFAGMVVGMLTFGYLSDKLGRKFGMVSFRNHFFSFSQKTQIFLIEMYVYACYR